MNLEKTKVDWSFSDKSKEVGYWYYINNKIKNIMKNGNEYKAIVDKYNVRLVYSTNRKDEIDGLDCDCSYHENEDNFCPHVYALVCSSLKVPKGTSDFNMNYLKKYEGLSKNKIKEKFVQKNIDIIDLDILGYNYEELFPDANDASLFDKLDRIVESLPKGVLEKDIEQTILEGKDTNIFDKEIINEIAYQKELEKEQRREQKEMRRIKFKGLIDEIFGATENNTVFFNNESESGKKDYELYQFEEEELEEDDYHYDDLD